MVQKKEKAVYIEASATESGWQNDPAVGHSLGQMQPEACFDTGKPAKGAQGGGVVVIKIPLGLFKQTNEKGS